MRQMATMITPSQLTRDRPEPSGATSAMPSSSQKASQNPADCSWCTLRYRHTLAAS